MSKGKGQFWPFGVNSGRHIVTSGDFVANSGAEVRESIQLSFGVVSDDAF